MYIIVSLCIDTRLWREMSVKTDNISYPLFVLYVPYIVVYGWFVACQMCARGAAIVVDRSCAEA